MKLKLILIIVVVFFVQTTFGKGRILVYPHNIDSLVNASIMFHRPVDTHKAPVLHADREWELNANDDPYAAPFSGGVWYDENDSIFKMWYSAGGLKQHGLVTCYAESHDGEIWYKPVLDVVSGTNIVDTLEHDCVTVLLDKYEKDSDKRYKMFCVKYDTPSAVSMVLKYSKDGIHWTEPVAQSGDLYDRCSAYFDPFRNKYVLSLKTKDENNLRARNYLANPDPELAVSLAHRVYGNKDDKFIKFWFSADADDPRHPSFPEIAPAIYNHDAIAYEGILLGQFVVWQGPENKDCITLNVQKRNEVLLGISEDGFSWHRPDKTPFIGVNEDPVAWNAGNIQSTMGSPIIVGDSLYFYYSGRYNSRPQHPSNFATGLAKIRRDGFASVTTDRDGFFITTPINVIGKYLFINADISNPNASLGIEVLDENFNPIPDFPSNSFIQLENFDSTKILCQLKDAKDLTNLKGKNVRIKFILNDCSIYSYWFSDSISGESGGYTAGGGPGLSPSGIDIIKKEIIKD